MSLLREAFSAAHLAAKPGLPVTGRYQMDDGGAFVFDRSTVKPLLKFDDELEIWVLEPAPGPRGDVIYRNDLGEPMLRATRLGGMTVFTEKRPDGSAAALDGISAPLRIASLNAGALYNHFYQMSVRARLRGAAYDRVRDGEGRRKLRPRGRWPTRRRWPARRCSTSLPVSTAGPCSATSAMCLSPRGLPDRTSRLKRGVLTITIVPAQGVFGRPSSRRIEQRGRRCWK